MPDSAGALPVFALIPYEKGLLIRFANPKNPAELIPFEDPKKIGAVFMEQMRWNHLMGVSNVADLNNAIVKGEFGELVRINEALHEKKIAEIADEICKEHKRIVLLAGPSSSGKTTTARRLCIQLKVNGMDPLYLGTDDYFVERHQTPLDENGEPDYENLGAVDIELFNDNMNGLLEGRVVDLPEFDFIEGKKIFGKRLTQLDPNRPIVIEGIHALNPELTKYIDEAWKYRIYISPFVQLNMDYHSRMRTTDARMIRRIVRDYKYRGKSAEATIDEWPKVRKGEDKNIFPYNGTADVLFNSALSYEFGILKKYAEPLLKNIGSDKPQYSEAQRLLHMLQYVKSYNDDSVVPNNSILKEFIGGSIFVEE
jgi:uridine kinase